MSILPAASISGEHLAKKSASSASTAQPPKPRKFQCQTCPKRFTTSGHLSRHSRIHTGEKNYACPFPGCSTRCSRKDNLSQHYRIHLGPGSRLPRSRRTRASRTAPEVEEPFSSQDSDLPAESRLFSMDVTSPSSRSSSMPTVPSSHCEAVEPNYTSRPILGHRPIAYVSPPDMKSAQMSKREMTSSATATTSQTMSALQGGRLDGLRNAPQSSVSPIVFPEESYPTEYAPGPTSPSTSSSYSEALLTPDIGASVTDGYFSLQQQELASPMQQPCGMTVNQTSVSYYGPSHSQEYTLPEYSTYSPTSIGTTATFEGYTAGVSLNIPYSYSDHHRCVPSLHHPQPLSWPLQESFMAT